MVVCGCDVFAIMADHEHMDLEIDAWLIRWVRRIRYTDVRVQVVLYYNASHLRRVI